MLGNKEKGSFGSSNTTTLISRDTEVVGDIKFSGNLDIEGVVRGNIVAQSGKDAEVRVVDKGLVEGEIRAPSIIVNGTVSGDVHATKHLELASKARVQGNVHYTLVEMAIGAEVNGSLKHNAEQPKKGSSRKPNAAIGMAEKPASAESVSVEGVVAKS
ncbi:MAG: polymer-forming cytoskeletal protein [Halieaceae bacterium]